MIGDSPQHQPSSVPPQGQRGPVPDLECPNCGLEADYTWTMCHFCGAWL